MNPIFIGAIFVTISCLASFIFVLLSKPLTKTKIFWCLMAFAVAFWSITFAAGLFSENITTALILIRASNIAAMFIPLFYFQFVIYLINQQNKYKYLIVFLYIINIFLSLLAALYLKYFVPYISSKMGLNFYANASYI